MLSRPLYLLYTHMSNCSNRTTLSNALDFLVSDQVMQSHDHTKSHLIINLPIR